MKFSALFLILLFTLTGCGFRPLYKQPSSNTSTPFLLEVRGNNDEAYGTYKFKQELQPLISHINNPAIYKIVITLNESFGDIGYASDASPLRSQGRIVAMVEIYDANRQLIYQNRLDSVSSYTTDISEEFSNLNAKMATRERLMISLAQDVARSIQVAVNGDLTKES
ncbi:hypothetical protein [Candidatus Finniella inopinata]|uniref:LPS-assembly lipoprotein LptE n=1 Tax=Candidatus Finniella inopinata TaxID=1696036 RepID=A0A4Q7DMB7_9PROT|nr:hypothetical protein [Candidatus Finniella inopinata]RZI45936.1 hypothetical protein EQU50_05755 [Candidatus Finniella inopinata]